MMKLKNLDAATFDLLAGKTRMRANAKAMARAVLVEELSLTEAAEKFNVTKQRIGTLVNTIRKVHDNNATVAGWVKMDVELPAAIAPHLLSFVNALQLNGPGESYQDALAKVKRALLRATVELAAEQEGD